VRRGHPWIYREQLEGPLASYEPGAFVPIVDPRDELVGTAIVDPGSPIAARIWTHGRAPLDEGVIKARIAHAIALRSVLVDASTTACRWVHGEGDRAPGVVIDRYETVAVVRLDGPAIARHVDAIADAAFTNGIESVVLRSTEKGAVVKIAHVRGKPPPDKIVVKEHGVPFVVDLAKGQKTGAFLDQRENRRRVSELSRGRRVLNLFSYAGGFSLRAALGGATHVTSVDVASGAHATAQASFKEAGLDPSKHSFVTADVFDFLERAIARGDKWDLVVSDPPNMAPSSATKARAIASYKRLHAACASVLAKNGIFCAASCSSHVGELDFYSTLTDEVVGDHLRIVESLGAGPDHPVLPGFPEGRYLEFCVLA
jgi:23S rRNA (cytosine1962-C5)-methyltransferase